MLLKNVSFATKVIILKQTGFSSENCTQNKNLANEKKTEKLKSVTNPKVVFAGKTHMPDLEINVKIRGCEVGDASEEESARRARAEDKAISFCGRD